MTYTTNPAPSYRASLAAEAQLADYHMYVFEAWPPSSPTGASYPLRLARHITVTAPDQDAARELAAVRCPPGWTLILAQHNRAHCHPTHPGR